MQPVGAPPFARSAETRADERALWLQRLLTSPVAALVDLVHGRLLPFTDLLSAAAAGEELPQGSALGAAPAPCAILSC